MLGNYHDLCTDDVVSRFISPVMIICVNIGTEHGQVEDDSPDSDIISTEPNASLSGFCFISLHRDCRGYLCTGCFTIIHTYVCTWRTNNVIRDEEKINLNHKTKYIFDKILSNFLYKFPFYKKILFFGIELEFVNTLREKLILLSEFSFCNICWRIAGIQYYTYYIFLQFQYFVLFNSFHFDLSSD